jgi:hypothetical protein
MRQLFKPSTILAILAVVIAASGSALAATKLVSGDKLIKKGTLSGNRLRKHTVTGTQINLNKLGKVHSAANADHATSATTAGSATNASDAAALGGQPASAFLASSARIGTSGIVKSAASDSGVTTTLFKTGPFTITMTCTSGSGEVGLTLSGSSTEAGSVINGNLASAANTPTDLSDADVPSSAGFNATNDVNVDLEAPSGARAILEGSSGVNSLGTACWSSWTGIQ